MTIWRDFLPMEAQVPWGRLEKALQQLRFKSYLPALLHCYRVKAYTAYYITGKQIKRGGIRARNSDFSRKPADQEDCGLVSQRTIFMSENSGSFYTKRGTSRALLSVRLWQEYINSFLPVVIRGWAWSGGFLRAKLHGK